MSGESKKEEFRKYLERSGVIDALTMVLVALYEEPEKPAHKRMRVLEPFGGEQQPHML